MHYAESRKVLERETTGRRQAGEMDGFAEGKAGRYLETLREKISFFTEKVQERCQHARYFPLISVSLGFFQCR